jgi:tRNA threonylcarbamoyl adenosine modification protein YeaZ
VIVALTTSSPRAGVALFREDGTVIGGLGLPADMAASGACLKMLRELLDRHALNLGDATLFAADLGPGSFTGVKVGITLAKTWAYALGVPVAGVPSFDLIDPNGTVVMPSKRGEFFVRRVGSDPIRTKELPAEEFRGFGPGVEPATYPTAEAFAAVIPQLSRLSPEALVANHLMEPSISTPKKPYGLGGAGG